MPHIANYISCRYHTAFFQLFIIREVLTQVGIVIIPLPVKAADTDSPAAIPVPSQRFYVAGFDCDNRRADKDIISTIYFLFSVHFLNKIGENCL
jgi:hypothetical protein